MKVDFKQAVIAMAVLIIAVVAFVAYLGTLNLGELFVFAAAMVILIGISIGIAYFIAKYAKRK